MAKEDAPLDGGDYYYTIGERLVEAQERPQRCLVGLPTAGIVVAVAGFVVYTMFPITDAGVSIYLLGVAAGMVIFLGSVAWCWLGEELEYWYREYMGPR